MINKVKNISGNIIEIDKELTCSVSGHRKINEILDYKKLKSLFESLIEKGINTFLVGMAVGFDSYCFRVLEEIKKNKKIRIIACIPCLQQDYKFNELQHLEYNRMLEVADEKILVSRDYTKYCMQKRNMFMIDNSSILVLYLKEKKGGSFNTYNYAKEKGINILEVSNLIKKI